ncbi:MAG: GGDEF domain-containing protein [Chloroflexi bacterium]|nr:GGDEF domain-containing protein [Chloroflexota bacterium]
MSNAQSLTNQVFAKIQNAYTNRPEGNDLSQSVQLFARIVETSGRDCELEAGEILLCENDYADRVYWIKSGALAILQGELENPRLLGFRHPGQLVGEIALLEDIPRTASIAAVVPTHLKSLTREEFHELLQQNPGVGIEIMRLLSARLREIQPAEYSAGLFDHLTGALSRRALDERLHEVIKRAMLYQYGFSLSFLDLDHFKEVNDNYGHARGDEILVAFAQRVMAELRTTDLLFRYGGDEFVLILQGTDPVRGQALIQRLMEQARTEPIKGDPPLCISFSAGVANFPEDGDTPKALLKTADERVYHSKRNGRGRVSGG